MAGEVSRAEAGIAALTGALRRGDESAWREFHGRYFGRLQRYLLVVTRGDEDVSQEALQQTFLRAVRHMKRFDSEKALWNWLAVLARSAAVDEQRKRARRLGLLARLLDSREECPGDSRDATARLAELLVEALASLPDDERTIVSRKYLEGASVRDLAASFDTTVTAVDSRLVRIRRKLKTAVLARLKHDA